MCERCKRCLGNMSFVYPLQLALVIDPYGTSPGVYPLTNSQNGWYVSDEATGMAPLHLIIERGPLQHGSTYLDFRLDDRTIVLVAHIQGVTEHEYQEHRNHLLRMFAPREATMALRWSLQDGTVRQIDGRPSGGLSLPRNLIEQRLVSGQGHKEAIEFHCFDPTFYDPNISLVVFDVGVLAVGMLVPTPVPTQIGTTTINIGPIGNIGMLVPTPVPTAIGTGEFDRSTTVVYEGTWRAYPEIRIYGPISDPIIINETTGETLDLTGVTIADGELWTIDLRYGYKTITDQDGTNQIATLSDDSDLATWHLKAIDLDLLGQDNVIRVQGSAGGANTAIQLAYYTRYIGI